MVRVQRVAGADGVVCMEAHEHEGNLLSARNYGEVEVGAEASGKERQVSKGPWLCGAASSTANG